MTNAYCAKSKRASRLAMSTARSQGVFTEHDHASRVRPGSRPQGRVGRTLLSAAAQALTSTACWLILVYEHLGGRNARFGGDPRGPRTGPRPTRRLPADHPFTRDPPRRIRCR
jgi:hypothetical protein